MRKELRVLLFSSGLFLLAGGLFGPIYAVFVKNIGGDLLTAGGAYSAFAICAGLLVFLISKWEDRYKYQERLVVLGFALRSTGFFGYLLIQTPIDLLIVQIILGIGEAVEAPAYDGLYSKYLDKGKFASEWGDWEAMNYIVTGISAAVGGFLAAVYGFRLLFVVMFVLSMLGLMISALLIVWREYKQSLARYFS